MRIVSCGHIEHNLPVERLQHPEHYREFVHPLLWHEELDRFTHSRTPLWPACAPHHDRSPRPRFPSVSVETESPETESPEIESPGLTSTETESPAASLTSALTGGDASSSSPPHAARPRLAATVRKNSVFKTHFLSSVNRPHSNRFSRHNQPRRTHSHQLDVDSSMICRSERTGTPPLGTRRRKRAARSAQTCARCPRDGASARDASCATRHQRWQVTTNRAEALPDRAA